MVAARGVCRAPGQPGTSGDLCKGTVRTLRVTGGVELRVNTRTSVVGSVAVGVAGAAGAAAAAFALALAVPTQGNALGAVASWAGAGGNFTASLSVLAGQRVAFEVAMTDAKLFSLELGCAAV